MTEQLLYSVMEIFPTLQGEGYYQGHASTFIRLAGCNVACVWCDVKESWDEKKFPLMNVESILNKVKSYTSKIVVITGGEPLLQNCDLLTKELQKAGYQCHVETSGTTKLSGTWQWITFSPKKFKNPIDSFCQLAHELKIVINHPSDFEWAEGFAKKVSKECKLFLQPEWEKSSMITPQIIEYIKKNPQWALSLQIHKFVNIP